MTSRSPSPTSSPASPRQLSHVPSVPPSPKHVESEPAGVVVLQTTMLNRRIDEFGRVRHENFDAQAKASGSGHGDVDRKHLCPSLIKCLVKQNAHIRDEAIAKRDFAKSSEMFIHSWPDATLKEIANLVVLQHKEAGLLHARIAFRVFFEEAPGRFLHEDIGTVDNVRPRKDEYKKLRESTFKFNSNDYIGIAIFNDRHPRQGVLGAAARGANSYRPSGIVGTGSSALRTRNNTTEEIHANGANIDNAMVSPEQELVHIDEQEHENGDILSMSRGSAESLTLIDETPEENAKTDIRSRLRDNRSRTSTVATVSETVVSGDSDRHTTASASHERQTSGKTDVRSRIGKHVAEQPPESKPRSGREDNLQDRDRDHHHDDEMQGREPFIRDNHSNGRRRPLEEKYIPSRQAGRGGPYRSERRDSGRRTRY